MIQVTAIAKGLAPGETWVASSAPPLPLIRDTTYAGTSKPAAPDTPPPVLRTAGPDDPDTAKLREQLHQLQLELTGKQQELMELRSTRGKQD